MARAPWVTSPSSIREPSDDRAIRRICRPLYAAIGRPSIPPEQLFLALVAGYLLGIPSDRRLVMELQCNTALRWFVGLILDQDAWDASTFSQHRRRRFSSSTTRYETMACRCPRFPSASLGGTLLWGGLPVRRQ